MTGYAHVPYLKCARDMPVFPDGDVKAKYIPFQRLAQKRLRSNWHRSRGLERKAHTRNGKFIRWASVQGTANSAGWAKDGIGLRLSGRQARKSRSPLATIACRERTSPGLTTSYTSRKKNLRPERENIRGVAQQLRFCRRSPRTFSGLFAFYAFHRARQKGVRIKTGGSRSSNI